MSTLQRRQLLVLFAASSLGGFVHAADAAGPFRTITEGGTERL